MIQAVTFDVTHTLIHAPHLGQIYSEVLRRHRVDVDPPGARRLVGEVWQEFACSADPGRDRFATHPEGERGWWWRYPPGNQMARRSDGQIAGDDGPSDRPDPAPDSD